MLNVQFKCDRCGTTVEKQTKLEAYFCSGCVQSYRQWATSRHTCWTASDGKVGCVARCRQCGKKKRVYNSGHDADTNEHVDMTCEQCAGGPYCERCGTPVPQWKGHKDVCTFAKQDLCDDCHREAARGEN